MPKKHGLSHAFAGMLSTIFGGLMIRITSERILGIDIIKYFGVILNFLPIKINISPETFAMSIFVFVNMLHLGGFILLFSLRLR